MIMFQALPKVYLYRDFIDFRKSINGLSAVVEQEMELPSTAPMAACLCSVIETAISSKFFIGIKPVLRFGINSWSETSSSGQPTLMPSRWCYLSSSFIGYFQVSMLLVINRFSLKVIAD